MSPSDDKQTDAMSDRIANSAIREGEVANAGDSIVKAAALDFAHGRVRAGIISTQDSSRAGRVSRILSVQAGDFVIAQHFRDNLIEQSSIRKAWKEIVGAVAKPSAPAAPKSGGFLQKLFRGPRTGSGP